MDSTRTNRPKLVITASPRGVKTVSIRVLRGERDMGLLFLRQVLPAIRTVNFRARIEPKNRAAGPRSAHIINQRRADMETTAGRTGKIFAMDVARLDESKRAMRSMQIEQNEERVARVREIVRVFNPEEIEQETNLSDMLANLMHLCDAEGWDFDAQIEQGRFHYDAESGDDPSKWIV